MDVVRVIVAGAVGAGKSTFVKTIGEMGVISTEKIATDQTSALKPKTTVALDFSRVTLNTNSADQILHIYGTPGQYRFNFMWEILLKKAQLCLVLVAAHRPESFPLTCQVISFIDRAQFDGVEPLPVMLALTHTDCSGALTVQAVSSALNQGDRAILSVDPHDPASIRKVLSAIVDPWVAKNG